MPLTDHRRIFTMSPPPTSTSSSALPQPLYRAAELRRIEQAAHPAPLMERAGAATAALAQQLATPAAGPLLILVGPGNNGGDALVAARLLRERFFDLCVVFPGDAASLPADAAAAYQRLLAAGGTTRPDLPDANAATSHYTLIIDGLFGIGLGRPLSGVYAALVTAANTLAQHHACPLLALDCPSGLNADTGQAGPVCINASHTLTFIAAKPGLYTADGPDHCGNIVCDALSLDVASLVPAATAGTLLGPAIVSACLPPRRHNSHKGSHGSAGIVGGAPGMLGAAILAGRASLKLGAGRVFVGLRDPHAPPFDPQRPELMLRSAEQLLSTTLDALAVGPGFGQDSHGGQPAGELLAACLVFAGPLLLDADALNLIAANDDLQHALAARSAATLLTPHPTEAARLLGTDTATVQADRIAAALSLASRFNAEVALKGCGTVLASPDGQWRINPTGNAGLASAGTGDVLSGMALALLAQGATPATALAAAVYVHGAAADALVAAGNGPIGLAADELADTARHLLNALIAT